MRGHPRMTVDDALLTLDHLVFDSEIWNDLREAGAIVEIRKGDFDDPLAGVVQISVGSDEEADVIVGKWAWQKGVIDRSERLSLHGVEVPVPRTGDLVLLKLAAGGYLDLQDVRNLLEAGDREGIVREVEAGIVNLPAEARDAWRHIVSSD